MSEAWPAAERGRLQVTGLAVPALLIGATSPLTFEVIAEIYVPEFLLPILAIVALAGAGGGQKLTISLKVFFALGLLMLFGYAVSDLTAHTEAARYLRGWARVGALVTDFCSLALLATIDRRLLWWYLLGTALGTLSLDLITHVPLDAWKFRYGDAVLTLAACSAYFLPLTLSTVLLITGGVVCVYLDSRAQGAFSLAAALALWARPGQFKNDTTNGVAYLKLLVVGTLLLAVLLIAVVKTQSTYGDRRDQSNTDRFTALAISLKAITKSPIIGYGSWGQGTDAYAEDLERSLIASGQQSFRTDIFVAHSQLLQSWMEGGLFAAAFFLIYGFYLLRSLYYLFLRRRADGLTPLFAFVLTMAIWHLFMSPFGGDHRLQIALGIAVICALEKERGTLAVKQAHALIADQPAVVRFPNLLR